MSLLGLAPSNKISTSAIRLALISRKTEIMKIAKDYPEAFSPEFYKKSIDEVDRFLVYINGSTVITAIKDDESTSSINFTTDELKDSVKGLPPDGYFKRYGDQLWYLFICNDLTIAQEKYEMLDVYHCQKWRPISEIDTPDNLDLLNKELRYLVLA